MLVNVEREASENFPKAEKLLRCALRRQGHVHQTQQQKPHSTSSCPLRSCQHTGAHISSSCRACATPAAGQLSPECGVEWHHASASERPTRASGDVRHYGFFCDRTAADVRHSSGHSTGRWTFDVHDTDAHRIPSRVRQQRSIDAHHPSQHRQRRASHRSHSSRRHRSTEEFVFAEGCNRSVDREFVGKRTRKRTGSSGVDCRQSVSDCCKHAAGRAHFRRSRRKRSAKWQCSHKCSCA